ncbi:hypothetical protein HPP92_028534 [Vanilla planifolia]|uniref:Ornithine cyclodeaminase n=1 Tax=Vanilla planifolia TaxID=51239 RepID=A0A835P5C8_VANPL|nr:hypothetical protein HPP92_028534 [Vanilla planifolia]
MRECDDDALVRGRVFVDFEEAKAEAGELVGAFERGAISPEDVVGTLVDLAGGLKVGRISPEDITVFKSVGTAIVDLLAAQLAYETHISALLPTTWKSLGAMARVSKTNVDRGNIDFNVANLGQEERV